MTKIYVGYLRVSTDRQGKSGLGIDAQRQAISSHIGNGKILCEYREIESGRRDSRPELKRALDHARRAGACLVVSKLDRLSRSAHFLLTVLNSGVDVEFADIPAISGPQGKFLLTSLAAVAELEAGMISQRTRDALQAAKARGQRLGAQKGKSPLSAFLAKHGNGAGVAGCKRAAMERAEIWRDTLEKLISEGLSNCGIARALNERGEKSVRGGRWSACGVQRLRARLAIV